MMATVGTRSPFAHVEASAGDPILTLNEVFAQDGRLEKVNLGIGVYLDEQGRLPLMQVVREAERRIFERASAKPYLPMAGALDYRRCAAELVFGRESLVLAEKRVATIQTVGGSGALRIGGDFLKQVLPSASVWVSDPTWDNHKGLLGGCGFEVNTYPYFDASTGGLDLGAMTECLANVPSGSIVVLHACCHNPTGVDPSHDDWSAIADVLQSRGLVAFIDMAYQGFGDGIEQDAVVSRMLAERGLSFLVASSFSKNLSVYGDRCGALNVVCTDASEAGRVQSQLQAAVRRNYSSPPSHGAAIVAEVLGDEVLRGQWMQELGGMRERISQMRWSLRGELEGRLEGQDFSYITRQRGMFSYTGLSASMVDVLRERHAIYLLRSGRACMTGLTPSNLDAVAGSFAEVMASQEPVASPAA